MVEFTRINTEALPHFFNRNGSSVIDYMLFEPNCLSMIKKNFAIIYKLVESDHCPIVFSLKAQPFCNTNKSIKAYDHVVEYKAYHKYSWNVSRIDQYKLSLRNDECIKRIKDHLTLNATSDRSSDHICELIRTNLTDTDNNNDYHNLCNDYKRMIRGKKRNYNTKLKLNLEKMCSNNPKDYWGF